MVAENGHVEVEHPWVCGPRGAQLRDEEAAGDEEPHRVASPEDADIFVYLPLPYDAPFVDTFVNLMVYQLTEERETSPADYARMIDEAYASALEDDHPFELRLGQKETAIRAMRKHLAAWESVEIPLQCRLAFLLCLQRYRKEPFVPPRTGFLGRLVARVKRARLPEDGPDHVIFKIANAPPDIVRNIAEYV